MSKRSDLDRKDTDSLPAAEMQTQYPTTLPSQRGDAVHIAWLGEKGAMVSCQVPWITSSCLGRKLRALSLMSLIPPEKQVHSVLTLKDAGLSLPSAEVSQPIFAFKWTDPEIGYSRQLA